MSKRTDVLVETGVGRRSFRAILNDSSPTVEYARVITEKGKRDSATRQAINSSKPRIINVPLSSRAARTRWVREIMMLIPSVVDWQITRIGTVFRLNVAEERVLLDPGLLSHHHGVPDPRSPLFAASPASKQTTCA